MLAGTAKRHGGGGEREKAKHGQKMEEWSERRSCVQRGGREEASGEATSTTQTTVKVHGCLDATCAKHSKRKDRQGKVASCARRKAPVSGWDPEPGWHAQRTATMERNADTPSTRTGKRVNRSGVRVVRPRARGAIRKKGIAVGDEEGESWKESSQRWEPQKRFVTFVYVKD
ncbi:hypothetical protein ERJ75_000907600 [Trypanosoma vivax]|nr:hypothetical protein ERJ75_000907600 [Trypanosoma vivax]